MFTDGRAESGIPHAEAPNAAAARKADDAKYGEGAYTFYLRNEKNITGDCDGYSYDGRWYTVYEYFQRDIAKWDERLFDVGIPHYTYRTSDITKYCSVTFSTEYVIGVRKEEGEHFIAFANDDVYFDMDKRGEGCRAKAENVWAMLYVRPDERLAFPRQCSARLNCRKARQAQSGSFRRS